MSTDSRPAAAGQGGQALLEALVGLGVLLAIWILAILLGKYQSIANVATRMSRQLAFECTVVVDECANDRAIASAREALLGEGAGGPGKSAVREGVHALWHDRSGRPMLDAQSGFGAKVSNPRFDAGLSVAAAGRSAIAAGALSTITSLGGPERFGLIIQDGLRALSVRLAVQDDQPRAGFDRHLMGMRLSMRASTAVLVDEWNASGPDGGRDDSVSARVDRGRRLDDALETALSAAYAPGIALMTLADALGMESGTDAFDREHLDVDILSPDRVSP